MKRLIALGIFGVFLFFSLTIWAQVPQLLNYQGRLTDAAGIPIITTTTLRFSLYQGGDAATPLSGTLCYQEEASVTPDDNGVFSHLIGSGSVIFGALDATVFQTADPVFLEITIDPAGANETLLPRKQIVTVGYSFKSELADDADTVDGQDASAFSPVVHNHDPDYVNEGQADSVTSAMIVNGTIVDADINASANIAGSKIDPTGLDADLLDGKDSLDFVHTTGDDMTGTLNVNTATQYALTGTTSNITGSAVYGNSSATSGTTYGVYGTTGSPEGYAVYGIARTYGLYGVATATPGTTFGVYGKSVSPAGTGVYGYALASSGANYGVYGKSMSPSGYGVYGTCAAGGYAGYFEGNAHVTGELTVGGVLDADLLDGKDSLDFVHTTGDDMTGTLNVNTATQYALTGTTSNITGSAVYGNSSATSGTTFGVYGEVISPEGYGVYGTGPKFGVSGIATSDGSYGVYGKSTSTSGRGVVGVNLCKAGATYGVYGIADSPDGYGVHGVAPTYGVYGYAHHLTDTHYGVYGMGAAFNGYGVYGTATNNGVYGRAWATEGVTYGVYGQSMSISGYGVYGNAQATSGTNYGIFGTTNSSSGYAGYFNGNAHVTGNLTVSGSKPCVQPIDNGKKVLLYAMESPEIWFEDFGTAQLVNGQAVVPIENVFAQTANIEMGYLVFFTPIGECQGLYIYRKDKDSFEVRELGDGTSSISFDYRIVAKRRGYEDVRFEEFTEPEQSPAEAHLPIERK